MSTRDKWAEILPILQAFVDGKEVIQVKDYDGRWKDTDTMNSLLHNSYRIRPKDLFDGVWSIQYTAVDPGSVRGPKAEGVWKWEGTNMDTPPWPKSHGITLLKETETFTPRGAV